MNTWEDVLLEQLIREAGDDFLDKSGEAPDQEEPDGQKASDPTQAWGALVKMNIPVNAKQFITAAIDAAMEAPGNNIIKRLGPKAEQLKGFFK